MAEGGNLSRSIEGGSDIVYEFVCTPCAADGSRLEALQFCQTCNQFLCDTCTKYHQRFTKSHHLTTAGSTKRSHAQTLSKTKSVRAKCHFHSDRDIEMYCGSHDMVYCSLCIATEHRSCNSVKQVENGIHKSSTTRLQQLVTDINRVHDKLRNTKLKKSANLKLIKTKKADLLKEIDKLRKGMNDHLDQLERKIKTELDEELKKMEQEICNDIAVADNLLTTVSEAKPDLSNTYDEKDMFIAEKLGRNVVSDINAFVEKVNTSKQVNLKFERNTKLYDDIKTTEHFGRLVRSCNKSRANRKTYVVKSYNRRNMAADTDKYPFSTIGMCQLPDGTILIADCNNNRLKRLDDKLNVKDFCDLQSKPFGLCSTSSTFNEAAVRYAESVQFIDVGQAVIPSKGMKNITKLQSAYGNNIAVLAGSVWTFGRKSIFVYWTLGDLIMTLDKTPQDQNLLPWGIAVSNDETKVYVTTGGDGVIVYNKNGDPIKNFRDQRLKETKAICVTEDDIVLVAGWSSKNVVMFDEDGNSLGELVSTKDMLDHPMSLCYDRSGCRLLIGFQSESIQVLDLKE